MILQAARIYSFDRKFIMQAVKIEMFTTLPCLVLKRFFYLRPVYLKHKTVSFLLKYKKLFGAIRILLGILFVVYPFSQYMKTHAEGSQDSDSWMFALIFFILYAVSAIANGLRELQNKVPSFNLLRFFEITLNSFVAIYIVIVIFAVKLNPASVVLFALLALVVAVSALRDMRFLSLQYYEKKQKLKEKGRKRR